MPPMKVSGSDPDRYSGTVVTAQMVTFCRTYEKDRNNADDFQVRRDVSEDSIEQWNSFCPASAPCYIFYIDSTQFKLSSCNSD